MNPLPVRAFNGEMSADVLPTPGLAIRPLTLDDAAAVTAVIAAPELQDIGEVLIEEADIVADWQRPSFDVAGQTVGVFDGEQLVAYADVGMAGRGDAAVLPSYRGRGLGTWLARWMQATARERGESLIGMPVPQGSPGERLLRSLGYHQRWTSWALALPPGKEIVAQPLPAGYTVRAADVVEREQVWMVLEDAFLEWSER